MFPISLSTNLSNQRRETGYNITYIVLITGPIGKLQTESKKKFEVEMNSIQQWVVLSLINTYVFHCRQ